MGEEPLPGACESCGVVTTPLYRWKRVVPERAILLLCHSCTQRTRRWADDRGDDSEYPRLVSLAQSLAGEIWTDDQLTYWFRDPLSVKKQPTAIPMWIPRVILPTPSQPSEAPKAARGKPKRQSGKSRRHPTG